MTDDPKFQRLQEQSWKRKLTPAEEAELRAWLAAHPDSQADWASENALNDVLERLPDVPVSSNFTARVLKAVELETAATNRKAARPSRPFWMRWLPRLAVASVVLGASIVSWQEIKAVQRAKMVHSVQVVSKVSMLPSPAILEDFDAIQRLTPEPAAADEQLLSLLQ